MFLQLSAKQFHQANLTNIYCLCVMDTRPNAAKIEMKTLLTTLKDLVRENKPTCTQTKNIQTVIFQDRIRCENQ